MYNELEKIDILRNRTKVSYLEAKYTLQQFGGDVIESLIYLEQENKKKYFLDVTKAKLCHWYQQSTNQRFVIEKDNKVYMDIPVPIVAAGLVIAMMSKTTALSLCCTTIVAAVNEYQFDIRKQQCQSIVTEPVLTMQEVVK